MLALNPVRNKQLMDAADLHFNDDSFDVVFCHALLHHVKNIDRVVFEMRRVSRKYIVILEPNILNPLMFLFSALKKEERGALRFTLSYLRRILKYNGLTLIASFSYGMIVPNKTPLFLLPIVKRLGVRYPFGMTNFLIAHK
jgi:SAM-dependent methyltransferase